MLVGFVMAGLMDDQVLTRRAMFRRIYIFTRVAYITRIGMWFPISIDSCLYCEDVTKPKLIYSVLMRPTIRPKHVSALNKCHVKTLFHGVLSNSYFKLEVGTKYV